MTYVDLAGVRYPATINGSLVDRNWENRDSKTINLAMEYAEAAKIFVDGLMWNIVVVNTVQQPRIDEEGNLVVDENGEVLYDLVEEETIYDNTPYCVAGPIVDNRDGTLACKMGRKLAIELKDEELAEANAALKIIMEGE